VINLQSQKFIVPDYYDDFKCKGGECRNSCCTGWGIAVSLKEYFKLLGLECSEILRREIDGGLRLAEERNEEHYAMITPRFDGNCPMRMKNGYCRLQSECGEKALPMICRYYPRSPRLTGNAECCCSNSCEKVIEMLIEKKNIITFKESFLSFEFPLYDIKNIPEFYNETRKRCIEIMSLDYGNAVDKIYSVGEFLKKAEEHTFSPTAALFHCEKTDEEKRLIISARLVKWFSDENESFALYGTTALNNINYGGDIKESVKIYNRRKTSVVNRFKDIDLNLSNIIINNMFYEKFPFTDKGESFKGEFFALCAMYMTLKYLIIGCLNENSDKTAFVDLLASAFRLIEHTSFYRNAAILLNENGITSIENAEEIL